MTLSAALLVWRGSETVLLTHWLIAWLGDISYSLYLIHWPIYSLLNTYCLVNVEGIEKMLSDEI